MPIEQVAILVVSGRTLCPQCFRKYLMTPGKMLCLDSSDLEAFNMELAQLTNKGLLVAERPHGGYSLTETGFAVMKDAE